MTQTTEDKILICEWRHWSVATSTLSLCRRWRRTFSSLLVWNLCLVF